MGGVFLRGGEDYGPPVLRGALKGSAARLCRKWTTPRQAPSLHSWTILTQLITTWRCHRTGHDPQAPGRARRAASCCASRPRPRSADSRSRRGRTRGPVLRHRHPRAAAGALAARASPGAAPLPRSERPRRRGAGAPDRAGRARRAGAGRHDGLLQPHHPHHARARARALRSSWRSIRASAAVGRSVAIEFEGDIAAQRRHRRGRAARRRSAAAGACRPAGSSRSRAGTRPRRRRCGCWWRGATRPGASATAWPTSTRRHTAPTWASGSTRARCSASARMQVSGVERYDPVLVPRLARLPPGTIYDREPHPAGAVAAGQQRLLRFGLHPGRPAKRPAGGARAGQRARVAAAEGGAGHRPHHRQRPARVGRAHPQPRARHRLARRQQVAAGPQDAVPADRVHGDPGRARLALGGPRPVSNASTTATC